MWLSMTRSLMAMPLPQTVSSSCSRVSRRPCALHECREQLELERADVDRPAAPTHLAAAEVHFGVAEAEHVRRLHDRASQHRLDARAQLARVERLGDVVVGAELEPHDLLGVVRPGGEDDDRRAAAAAAQLATDLEAVLARQHDVEQDERVVVHRRQTKGIGSGRGDRDLVSLARQVGLSVNAMVGSSSTTRMCVMFWSPGRATPHRTLPRVRGAMAVRQAGES